MPEPTTSVRILRRLATDLVEVWGEDSFTLADLSERITAEMAEDLAFRAEVNVADIDRVALHAILAPLIAQWGMDHLVFNSFGFL